MPCYEPPSELKFDLEAAKEILHLRSWLCGLMLVLEQSPDFSAVISSLDEQKMGLSRTSLLEWWKIHKCADFDKQRG